MTAKLSMILLALVAGAALAQAAGGIKGAQRAAAENSAQRPLGLKRPQQQQIYLPPPPPPAPLPAAPIPQPLPLPVPAPAPIKGPGQVAPVFTAARVAPPAPPAPLPLPLPLPAPAPAPIQQIQQQVQEQEPEQQQQQAEEIDPNAAAQDAAPAIAAPAVAAPVAVAPAAVSEEEANPRPEPYAFNYAFEAGDAATSGSSQREEQQDANGKVTGFYTLRGEDGRDRRVDYVADADGFRATISTNEMGTADKDTADVDWQAQSPSDAQLRSAESATQAARQRALLNPQVQQQQIQAASSASSSSSSSKVSSPRQNSPAAAAATASQQRDSWAAKGLQQQAQQQIAQLQEPFEQIRQTELNARARKSRHAPFYLYTV